MGTVVRLATYRSDAAGRGMIPARLRSQMGFTSRDHADLEDWSADDLRVSLCSCDMGAFAMLYRRGAPWASWGLVRQERMVLLWDCVTLADIGRYPSMFDALGAVPVDRRPIPIPSVLRFAAVERRVAVN